MASMSYCMFENTSIEMGQLLGAMEEAADVEDLDFNQYEQRAFDQLKSMCEEYLFQYNRLVEAGE
jgi:hypothetical protein